MGIFDGGKSEQIKYLDDERKKLWDRLIQIESNFKIFQKEVEKKTPEFEREARGHSKKASEFRNKIEEKHKEAESIINQIDTQLLITSEKTEKIKEKENEIEEILKESEESKSKLTEIISSLNLKYDVLNLKIKNIESILEKYPDLEEKISSIESFVSEIEENKEKSLLTLNEVNKKKKEIDTIHRSIYGYTQSDELNGTSTKVSGLKDELEEAYSNFDSKLSESKDRLDTINGEYENKFEGFEAAHKEKYTSIIEEIKSLLPNALTAGLSSAFSKKKDDELIISNSLQSKFNIGIVILIIISIIPFGISIYFLANNIDLLEVINRIPRIVLSIVPMYIPALWFTISASKKLNLSKRLIEEYSHKEVLSKTYEGLSNQIANIQDPEQSEELKFRLLTNFLQVTSENPGKLISNYNTSDHPVMEALEQSYKFQLAIDKLDSIPGLGKVAAILEKKAKRKLDDKAKKIDDGVLKETTEE